MCICYRMCHYIAAGAVIALVGVGAWNYFSESCVRPALQVASANADDPKKADGPSTGAAATVDPPGKSDHTMFGGTPARNFVNLIDTDIPGTFKKDDAVWVSKLGTKAYGGPTIANGRIFCGTNNENPRNKRDRAKPTDDEPMGPPIDKGIVMCFREKDGEFLWQAVHDKLPSGQAHDWEHEGVCSSPIVDEGRVYYVSNRCSVVCATLNGFDKANNQGFQGEKFTDKTDVDVIWEYDMMKELRVFPHNMSACSPMIIGDLIFIVTANGVDFNHVNIPSPEAPSFIALSKKSGRLVWKSSAPGLKIMHGQWSNPAYGVIKGVPQVVFPGGDGLLHSFKPDTGEMLWTFDANPKDAKYELGAKGVKSDFIGTPVFYKEKIYIGTGQDPEHLEGVGHFWCIDPAGKTGDISGELVTDDTKDPPATKPNPNSAVVWQYGGYEKAKFAKRDYVFGRTMSSACIVDDICYISELAGYLHCIDAKTGKKYWQFDLKSNIWGSAYFVDGKVFVGNEDGDLFVFKHEKAPAVMDEVAEGAQAADEKAANAKRLEVRKAIDKRYKIAKIEMEEPIRSTPTVANGVLYVMSERSLFAFKSKK